MGGKDVCKDSLRDLPDPQLTVNGKVYVGSAVNLRNRWRTHKQSLNKGTSHCRHLQAAWIKHGAAAFVFEIIETVERKEDLIPREQAYIDSLSAADRLRGYNAATRAGSVLGVRWSAEKCAEHSKTLKQYFNSPASAEVLVKISARMRGTTYHLGHKHSEETRAKMSAFQKSRGPVSAETRAKISAGLRGKTNTLGYRHTDEARAKVSASLLGAGIVRGASCKYLVREKRYQILGSTSRKPISSTNGLLRSKEDRIMQIPLLGLGLQGKSVNLNAARRLNLYLQIDEQGEKSKIAAFCTPGLELFYDFGATPVRGMHGLGDYIYCCQRGSFYRINNAAVAESLGTLLSTTGQVGIADNGTQVMVVDGTAGYTYTIATGAFAQITAAGFPNGATTVTFLDGYFVVDDPANAGRFYKSGLYDGTSWNALDYATAESNPDALVRPMAEKSLLGLFGEFSTEVWANTGALDFPFSRMQGGAVEWGLAARWSLCKFDDGLIWLARNRLGQVSVVAGSGAGGIQRVSTSDLDYLFSTYSGVSGATAYSYMLNGHPLYQISFPVESRSWLYDGKTGAWSELQSYGLTRHRGETQTSFLDNIMVGDFENGRIYKLLGSALTDNGDPIVRELISPHSFGPDDEQGFISEIRLDMETGLGTATGQGSDPQIQLSISRDGGHSFGTERWTSAGKTGEYRHRARWRRCGRARDLVVKIRISDPIPVNLIRASADYERGTS